jgi:hypothetical protein
LPPLISFDDQELTALRTAAAALLRDRFLKRRIRSTTLSSSYADFCLLASPAEAAGAFFAPGAGLPVLLFFRLSTACSHERTAISHWKTPSKP